MANVINATSTGNGGLVSTGDDSGILNIQTNETTAITVDASQNVGIGVTAPSAKLNVRTSTTGSTANGIMLDAGAQQHSWYLADNFTSTFSIGSSSGQFTWANSGGERMRIDSSGNLLVGKTTVGTGSTVGVEIRANGQINSTSAGQDFWNSYNSTAGAYRFYVTAPGTVFATSTTISAISDVRFKENIRDLDVGLTKVMALRPRLYDWKEGKGANIKNARGFIAQEFETVFPDMIDEWKDPAPEGEEPYKSVRADLIPTLVKAIQELKAINDTQAETLTQQTEAINALTARIVAIESRGTV